MAITSSQLAASIPITRPNSARPIPRPSKLISIGPSRFSALRRRSATAGAAVNGGSISPDSNDRADEFSERQYDLPSPPRSDGGASVYVALPVDSVLPSGKISRKKTLGASLMALSLSGVEGIVVEVWWGVVESSAPEAYNWGEYGDIFELARRYRLKVRAIFAFHQCGIRPGDSCRISLPQWVIEEMDKEPELAYSDRFGRRSLEYISLGCDAFPVLRGRSPIQAYTDFMRNFRDTFKEFLGDVITGIQVGMGPGGELRYPSVSPEKLLSGWRFPELGEFMCYDKYMIASLNANARNIGMWEWGNGGPLGAGNIMQNPEETKFFSSNGSWNSAYGRFFLEWYSGMLLTHGERLCKAAETIFWGTGVKMSAKVASIYWHYNTRSHPSELTAGYYNTSIRDGYLPIAQMLSKYGMTLCLAGFDVSEEEEYFNLSGSPMRLLQQLISAARKCGLPLTGENSGTKMDDISIAQVIRTSKLCSDGFYGSSFSFNFMRLNKNLFDPRNWARFTRFVRQMSDGRTFLAKLDFGESELFVLSRSSIEDGRLAVAYY